MTPDRIKEILEGCEGVTPGPWYLVHNLVHDTASIGSDTTAILTSSQVSAVIKTFEHFTRLDPDTVRQLCLLALKGLEQEWQPIETALKDGTPIYVYFFEPDQVRIVSFSNKAPDDSHRDADKYYWYDAAKDSFWNERHAKMWMPIPLPSPPIQEQS